MLDSGSAVQAKHTWRPNEYFRITSKFNAGNQANIYEYSVCPHIGVFNSFPKDVAESCPEAEGLRQDSSGDSDANETEEKLLRLVGLMPEDPGFAHVVSCKDPFNGETESGAEYVFTECVDAGRNTLTDFIKHVAQSESKFEVRGLRSTGGPGARSTGWPYRWPVALPRSLAPSPPRSLAARARDRTSPKPSTSQRS